MPRSPVTTADELSCKELVELITAYLEGVMPPAVRQRFEAHLAICEGCRTYLEQMRLTVKSVGALREEAIPEKAKQDLLKAFRNWKNQ